MDENKLKDVLNFKKYLLNNFRSSNTIETYMISISQFIEYSEIKDNNEFYSLKKEDILKYKNYLENVLNRLPNTVNSKLTAINSFLRFIGMEESLVSIKNRRMNYINEKALTNLEIKKLLKFSKKYDFRLYLIMRVFIETGIRISELIYVTVCNINNEHIKITKSKYEGIRTIHVSKSLTKILRDYCRANNIKSGHIFISKKGKPLSRSYIHNQFKSLAKLAKVKEDKVFAHNFRHYFTMSFLEVNNFDLVGAANVLGHKNTSLITIYATESYKSHQKKMNKLSKYFNKKYL
jgi:integrase